jgi:hypothetical protein
MSLLVPDLTIPRQELVNGILTSTRPDQAPALLESLVAMAGGSIKWLPVGNLDNNAGLMRQPGHPDYRSIELMTNGIDAHLDHYVQVRFPNGDAPFTSPQAAGAALLADEDWPHRKEVEVSLRCVTGDPRDDKALSILIRDYGIGVSDFSKTLLSLGSKSKNGVPYLMGAYGSGGLLAYPDADLVWGISRPQVGQPGHEDLFITCVQLLENDKYEVDPYAYIAYEDGRSLKIPAAGIDFEPGTALNFINHHSRDMYKACKWTPSNKNTSQDPQSCQALVNSRLPEAPLPIRIRNETLRPPAAPEDTVRQGIIAHLNRNGGYRFHCQAEAFAHIGGQAYRIPLEVYGFTTKRQLEARVAKGHSLLLTSNGQTHAIQDATQMRRLLPEFNEAMDNILVIARLDEIPRKPKALLFNSSRSQIINDQLADEVYETIALGLRSCPEIPELERFLVRQRYSGEHQTQYAAMSRQLDKDLQLKADFGLGPGAGRGSQNRRGQHSQATATPLIPIVLLDEPTELTGPDTMSLSRGSKWLGRCSLNTYDSFHSVQQAGIFASTRAPGLQVNIASLHAGYFNVQIDADSAAALGEQTITLRTSNPRLEHTITVEVTAASAPRTQGARKQAGGSCTAMVLVDGRDRGWPATQPGRVVEMTGANLAQIAGYEDYAVAGTDIILVAEINADYKGRKRLRVNWRDAGFNPEKVKTTIEDFDFQLAKFALRAYRKRQVAIEESEETERVDQHDLEDMRLNQLPALAAAAEEMLLSLKPPRAR